MRNTFSKKIGLDLQSFFNDCLSFVESQNQNLVTYYTEDGYFPKKAFDDLDALVQKGEQISKKIILNREKFESYSDFLIVDQIEDFFTVFDTIKNYSKWFKSSTIKGRFKTTVEKSHVLQQNQTLEAFSKEIGYSDREKGFLDLSLRNQIKETDYTTDGGLVFSFSQKNDQSLKLTSVVDEMTGENLLGKDISKKLSFLDNDLLYLSPVETFEQACDISTGLLKNSNPEFPSDGFDRSALSNKNILRCRLASFIRQIYAVVRKDDTIKSFSIIDITFEQDALSIEIQYESYLGDIKTKRIVHGN